MLPSPLNPFVPQDAIIKKIKTETVDVRTYTIAFHDESIQKNYTYDAGQYNMVSLPGIGEAPLSISSSSHQRDDFDHTVRFVGRVTNAWSRLTVGDSLGIRGPYGRPWPIENLAGKDAVVIAGGTGIACIKPAINQLVENPDFVRSATIFYGAKTPRELVFADQYEEWTKSGVNFHLTVDTGKANDWPFHLGVVTTLFDQLTSPPSQTVALISGPEIMMRFCVFDLIKRGLRPNNIFLSLERRMDCAIRMCGHCQMGPKYICQDGPVFSYQEVEHFFGVVS